MKTLFLLLVLACGTSPSPVDAYVEATVRGDWDSQRHEAFEAELLALTQYPDPGVRARAWRDLGDVRVAVAELLWSLDESTDVESEYRMTLCAEMEPRAWTWRHGAMDAWRESLRIASDPTVAHRIAVQEAADAARTERLEKELAPVSAKVEQMRLWIESCDALAEGAESLAEFVETMEQEVVTGSYDPASDAKVLDAIHATMASSCG